MHRNLLKLIRRGRKEDFWGFTQKESEFIKSNEISKMMPTSQLQRYNDRLVYHEAEARLYKVLKDFSQINLQTFNSRMSFRELNMDSLQTINLITAVEREFNTVFEEEVFDSFDCCEDIMRHMISTRRAF